MKAETVHVPSNCVRRDTIAWEIWEGWATDRVRWKVLGKIRYPAQGDGGER